jgi:predicted amidophosphoribosyltransferase
MENYCHEINEILCTRCRENVDFTESYCDYCDIEELVSICYICDNEIYKSYDEASIEICDLYIESINKIKKIYRLYKIKQILYKTKLNANNIDDIIKFLNIY